ncbi:MAG: MFS transporter [Thaumarchaeota archaeon]|nr:MFS transporter [Nitrososphaerota archaeon]
MYSCRDDGPVLIEIEYIIDNTKSNEFEYAAKDLRILRLRDGAINWALFRDIANPSRYVETFVAESWAEHLRQHERITKADMDIENRAKTFHVGKTDPVVDHFIGTTIPKKNNIRKVE